MSVNVIISSTVDWANYNAVLVQNATLRGKVMEMVRLLKRDGYDVFVVVRESA